MTDFEVMLGGLSDSELMGLLDAARAEWLRRETLAAALEGAPTLIPAYLESLGREPGAEYVAPSGAHDAYPLGWEVTHDGKTWVALRDGATGVPGDSPDWQQVAEDGEILPWVQPHAGAEYAPGAVVTHEGRTWRNDRDTPNGHEPGVAHSGWTDITDD